MTTPQGCNWDEFACHLPINNQTVTCLSWSQYNCSMYDFCGCPYMKGDPDIAGIGVVSAFVVTTFITLVLSILYLALRREYDPSSLNRFDRPLRRLICKPIRAWLSPAGADKWAERLYKTILTLSDTQLVTGIAILCSAIELTRNGDILVYHYNLVSDLAWFCSNTHLLSLLVIQAHLGGFKAQRQQMQGLQPQSQAGANVVIDKRDWLRYSRAFLMTVTAVLLLYVNWTSGVEDLWDNINCPMECMVNRTKGGTPLKWTIVNMVLIIWSYPVQILRCIPGFARWWLDMRDNISIWVNSTHTRLRQSYTLLDYGYVLVQSIIYWLWNFFCSELETILELTGWLVYGLVIYVQDRNLGKNGRFLDDTNDFVMPREQWDVQGQFSFGQMVPLFMLLLPLSTFIEAMDE